ncbi:MAG: flavodoxin family protein [Anaerolineales bacterium]|jgi:flavodoxin
MKVLVAFDSQYGNTEKIARAIAEAFTPPNEVEIKRIPEVDPGTLSGFDLLIAGSPTQRLRPTEATSEWIKNIPANGLRNISVAAFDTRLTDEEIEKVRIFKFFVGIFGFAADPIAKELKKKGGTLVVPPEGFYVTGTEGPLVEGELERAQDWSKSISRPDMPS